MISEQPTDEILFNLEELPEGGTITTLEDLIGEVTPATPPANELNIGEAGEEETTDLLLEDEPNEVIDEPNSDSLIVSEPYRDVLNLLIESGEWQPIETMDDGNGNEIPFADVVLTKELFNEILTQQNAERKERLLANRIDITNTSEFTKKLIEIESNGGSVKQAIDAFQVIQEPLSAIDISTEEGQMGLITMDLKTTGVDEEVIPRILEEYKVKGILDEKAVAVEAKWKDAFNKHIEKINSDAIAVKTQKAEREVEFKKIFKESIKTTFELNDNYQRKVTEFATKKDDKEQCEIDAVYRKKRNDPKEAAEIALFLLDREEYIKQKTKEEVNKVNLNTQTTFKFAKKGQGSLNIESNNTNKKQVSITDL